MRTETFKDEKMKDILSKKDVLITEGRGITVEIEELEKKRNKIALKIEKLKGRMIASVEKRDFTLEEFEYLRTVELKDGEIEVSIGNAQEDWMEAYREQKKETEKS